MLKNPFRLGCSPRDPHGTSEALRCAGFGQKRARQLDILGLPSQVKLAAVFRARI